MRRLQAALALAALLAPQAGWSATRLVGPVVSVTRDAGGSNLRDAAPGFDPSTWSLFGALSTARSDEPYALDEQALAARIGAAGERNPFALAALLFAFASLTAFFARKRSAGRGLISA